MPALRSAVQPGPVQPGPGVAVVAELGDHFVALDADAVTPHRQLGSDGAPGLLALAGHPCVERDPHPGNCRTLFRGQAGWRRHHVGALVRTAATMANTSSASRTTTSTTGPSSMPRTTARTINTFVFMLSPPIAPFTAPHTGF